MWLKICGYRVMVSPTFDGVSILTISNFLATYIYYDTCPSWVILLLFRVELPSVIAFHIIMFCFPFYDSYCHHKNLLKHTNDRKYTFWCWILVLIRCVQCSFAPLLFWVWDDSCYSCSCFLAFPSIHCGSHLCCLCGESPDPSSFYSWWGWVFYFTFRRSTW